MKHNCMNMTHLADVHCLSGGIVVCMYCSYKKCWLVTEKNHHSTCSDTLKKLLVIMEWRNVSS